MEVLLVSNKLSTDNNALICVAAFFKGICKVLEYDDNNIEKIVFADADNYGNEIRKVDQNASYTNTKEHTGFGKTMYLENGKNIIVLNECFFQLIVGFLNGNDYNCYPNKLYLHLIAHELGHCIQNTKKQENEIVDYNDLRQISTINNYYFPILVDEFEANRNIIVLYNEDDLTTEIETFFIDDIAKYSNKYFGESLNDFESISIFWMLNIQYAKLCALLLEFPISKYEEYFMKVHSSFNYKEILNIYKKYSNNLISKDDLLACLIGYI